MSTLQQESSTAASKGQTQGDLLLCIKCYLHPDRQTLEFPNLCGRSHRAPEIANKVVD